MGWVRCGSGIFWGAATFAAGVLYYHGALDQQPNWFLVVTLCLVWVVMGMALSSLVQAFRAIASAVGVVLQRTVCRIIKRLVTTP